MKNLRITVNGNAYDVQVEELGGDATPTVSAAPAPMAAPVAAPVTAPAPAAAPKAVAPAAGANAINAPMPGTIVSVNVTAGQSVKKGDTLVVLEAMKMENEIMAPDDCVVAAVHVNKGDNVDSGTPLVSLQ